MGKYYQSAKELLTFLQLKAEQVDYSSEAEKSFRFMVPESFALRMQKGNPSDPLLLQVLPQSNELQTYPDFSQDPLQEEQVLVAPGLLKKYQKRLLLVTTSACAIHCRYCFRRHFPYQEARLDWLQLEDNLKQIENYPETTEVILSGGDPLSLTDKKFAELLRRLGKISHLKRIRIHTRKLVVSPSRITSELIKELKQCHLPIVIVLHINHANELDLNTENALLMLRQVPKLQLLNQAVLLKSVNDSSEDLIALSERLFEVGIIPYYLHMLDPVAGSQHFWVAEQKAKQLHESLKQQLPGYLVPKLVRELPGDEYKQEV